MRSLNTQITAMLPIISVLVVGSLILGATDAPGVRPRPVPRPASGAYSSIFIASPVLALLKEREPRYRALRKRLEERESRDRSRRRPRGRAGPRRARARADATPEAAADGGGQAAGHEAAKAAAPAGPLRLRAPGTYSANHPPPAAQEGEAALSRRAGPGPSSPRTSSATSPTSRSPGIVFKDITPLLADAEALPARRSTASPSPSRASSVDRVLGVEARGFITAAPVAYLLGAGFVPGPQGGQAAVARSRRRSTRSSTAPTCSRSTATRCAPGERVLIVDDVLATGGTAAADRPAGRAARRRGRRLRVPDRAGLPRRPCQLEGHDVTSLIRYD